LAAAGAPDLQAAFAGARVEVPYSLVDVADDAIAVLDDAGVDEAHLVGMSMGGFISRWAALAHPDRVASLTLVVTGSGAGPADDGPQVPNDAVAQLADAAQARERDEHIAGSVEFWRWLWAGGFPFPEEEVLRRATAAHDRSYRPEGMQRQLLSAFATPGLWDAQREIGCPTLILHGDRDPIFPAEHGQAMRERIPRAELWLVERVGHSIPHEIWPEFVSRVSAQVHQAQGSTPVS
jgi:pimeloyl-ACP methyl ester carboxylesterase